MNAFSRFFTCCIKKGRSSFPLRYIFVLVKSLIHKKVFNCDLYEPIREIKYIRREYVLLVLNLEQHVTCNLNESWPLWEKLITNLKEVMAEIWKPSRNEYILIVLGFICFYIGFYICFQRFFVQRETNNNQNWMMTRFHRGSNMKMKT